MMRHQTDVETIRAATNIVAFVGAYMPLKRLGNTSGYLGLCPFHAEKTPSLRVDNSRQRYHCFGCKADGDIFDFVQRIECVTFPQAKEMLASWAGIQSDKLLLTTQEDRRRYARARESAGRIAASLTLWRQEMIDTLRQTRNLCWQAEQHAYRLAQDHGQELSEEAWELIWRAVILQPHGDRCNRALNAIGRAPADLLLKLYRQKQAA